MGFGQCHANPKVTGGEEMGYGDRPAPPLFGNRGLGEMVLSESGMQTLLIARVDGGMDRSLAQQQPVVVGGPPCV